MKIYWRPRKLIEDPLTGKCYVLMYGGGGLVRYVSATDIQEVVYDEKKRISQKFDERINQHQ